jgi:putative PIN family toxin of toxin-antitoxin system
MRVVLDTNTVISGLFWRGKPFQVLELMRSGTITVYTSEAILEELLDVLKRLFQETSYIKGESATSG